MCSGLGSTAVSVGHFHASTHRWWLLTRPRYTGPGRLGRRNSPDRGVGRSPGRTGEVATTFVYRGVVSLWSVRFRDDLGVRLRGTRENRRRFVSWTPPAGVIRELVGWAAVRPVGVVHLHFDYGHRVRRDLVSANAQVNAISVGEIVDDRCRNADAQQYRGVGWSPFRFGAPQWLLARPRYTSAGRLGRRNSPVPRCRSVAFSLRRTAVAARPTAVHKPGGGSAGETRQTAASGGRRDGQARWRQLLCTAVW